LFVQARTALAQLSSAFTGFPGTLLAETWASKKVHTKKRERKIFFFHKKLKFS